MVGLYLLAVTPPLLVGPWNSAHVLVSVVHVAAVVASLSMARRTGAPSKLMAWAPLLALPLLYWEIPFLNQGLGSGYHDPVIVGWEALLFGSPATELAGRFPSLALSESLHLAYIAYYPVIYVPPAILFFRGRFADGRHASRGRREEALAELDTETEESFQRAFEKLLLETTTRNLIAIA